jgi:hypothetical protein
MKLNKPTQPKTAIRLAILGALTVISTVFGLSGTNIPALIHISSLWFAILILAVLMTNRDFIIIRNEK